MKKYDDMTKTLNLISFYRNSIDYQWISNDVICYRVLVGKDASQFYTVDCTSGIKRLAFDQQSLASSSEHNLSQKRCCDLFPTIIDAQEFTAENMPFQSITIEKQNSMVHFAMAEKKIIIHQMVDLGLRLRLYKNSSIINRF